MPGACRCVCTGTAGHTAGSQADPPSSCTMAASRPWDGSIGARRFLRSDQHKRPVSGCPVTGQGTVPACGDVRNTPTRESRVHSHKQQYVLRPAERHEELSVEVIEG